jgi:putative photosynthetic complex assembly protein 2
MSALNAFLLPTLYATVVWWASTGAILLLVGWRRSAPVPAALAALGLAAAGLVLLVATRSETGPLGAYGGFTAAILLWGAVELAFLAGWITGPWRRPCPPDASGVRRTGLAIGTVLYHEAALALVGFVTLLVTLDRDNQVGPWTFGALLAMRISAKLNVFLGVPNITESFLPARLDYLKSFFGRRPMNVLFPFSITAATVALALVAQRTLAAEDPGAAAGLALLSVIVALGLLEHWLLVLPLPAEALWSWGMPKPASASDAPPVAARSAEILRLEVKTARARDRSRTPSGARIGGRSSLSAAE